MICKTFGEEVVKHGVWRRGYDKIKIHIEENLTPYHSLGCKVVNIKYIVLASQG